MTCIDCEKAGRALTRPVVATVKIGSRVVKATGKRCDSDEKEHQKARRARTRLTRAKSEYGLEPAQEERLLAFQGGVCAHCGTATGASKGLAHDHDHRHCSGRKSCGLCVRGRLCSTCNQLFGEWKDSPVPYLRAALYAMVPIAHFALARVTDDEGVEDWAWTPEAYHAEVDAWMDEILASRADWIEKLRRNSIPEQRRPMD